MDKDITSSSSRKVLCCSELFFISVSGELLPVPVNGSSFQLSVLEPKMQSRLAAVWFLSLELVKSYIALTLKDKD